MFGRRAASTSPLTTDCSTEKVNVTADSTAIDLDDDEIILQTNETVREGEGKRGEEKTLLLSHMQGIAMCSDTSVLVLLLPLSLSSL